jgi:hypothetical protein
MIETSPTYFIGFFRKVGTPDLRQLLRRGIAQPANFVLSGWTRFIICKILTKSIHEGI